MNSKRNRLIILFIVVVFIGYWLHTKLNAIPLLPSFEKNRYQFTASISEENLKTSVDALTTISPPRNHRNIASLHQAAKYIEDEFYKYCPQLKRQTFMVNDLEHTNIICLFGEEKDLIVIGAHYDVDGESIGADDNASGVAGLLELARLLKEQPSQQNITLVAYSLEELPHFRTKNMGSYHHAKYLKDNNISLKYMLSLEMIGYFSNEENSQKVPSRLLRLFYPTTGNFISIIGRFGADNFISDLRTAMKYSDNLPVYALHAPENLLQNNSSDQLNYWEFGYDAAMITDTGPYRNPHYHKISDTPETLDFHQMAKVIAGVYAFIK